MKPSNSVALSQDERSVDIKLVHNVNLADPKDLSKLTVSGLPRIDEPYDFNRFINESGFHRLSEKQQGRSPPHGIAATDLENEIGKTMRMAYYNIIREAFARDENVRPLAHFIIELNDTIRSLVPRRKDLHALLPSDEQIQSRVTSSDPDALFSPILQAGEALAMLEAPDRVDSTEEWIRQVRKWLGQSPKLENAYSFDGVTLVVASTAYLIQKAEMCREDIRNAKLVLAAPSIRQKGVDLERQHFQRVNGDFGKEGTAPATKKWMERIAKKTAELGAELISSGEKRIRAVKTVGFVEDILFSSQDDGPKAMPEILAMDAELITRIRQQCRTAVIGSSLALHVCTIVGISDSVLKLDPLPVALGEKHLALTEAMEKGIGQDMGITKNISDALLALATEMKPDLTDDNRSLILGRARAVLRNEDPVINLLDNRMRTYFKTMIEWTPSSNPADLQGCAVPVSMKTGRLTLSNNIAPNASFYETPFMVAAKRKACENGFSFYSFNLASACESSRRIVNLMIGIYGNVFLNELLIQECNALR